ncbi:spore coat U domain-containing protein [Undibacterium sp. CY18W]|uniref:Spore coat U domain-containing protein n=1 Tax=Undibacterium hunanense TaxID=2762292 RepID=A0ABR6ZR78_9BURK|nr:spore coat U domain-containing protein [Undibacterium hunanense]MBC3918402.1 spore coat U domain-containing protein [Undibacterium hunanense]
MSNANRHRLIHQLLPAVFLCMTASSFAATSTGSLSVSSTVLAACSVTGASLAFGSYTNAQIDNSAAVSVTCTNGTSYNVGLDAGGGSGATMASRKMTGSVSGTLSYSLYKDAGRSTVWGNTVGSDTAIGTGTGSAQSMSVYGRVPSGQNVDAGVYSDTVTVTLTY